MIDRRILTYFSMIFVTALCYALIQAEKEILSGLIGLAYLVFAFGIDKFKLDLKNKKIEIEDEHKD
jgi:hypothetical protein